MLKIKVSCLIWTCLVQVSLTQNFGESEKVYLTSVAVTVFILPALFITLCHVVMVVRIWQAAANTEQALTVPLSQSAPVKKLRRAIDYGCRDPPVHHANNDSSPRPCNKTGFRRATPIRMKTSPGCIPRARIKTVKMTLVIVSGKSKPYCRA